MCSSPSPASSRSPDSFSVDSRRSTKRLARGHRLGVELAGRREARADGVHVRARRQPLAAEDRLARARARADDVRAPQRPPRRSPPSRRLHDPDLDVAEHRAHRLGSASAPARRRRGSRRPARPGRASARVATAETAAVRISVIGEAFRIARSSPVSPSWRSTAPWCASSPRAGLPGTITISFSDHVEPSPPLWAGMKPIRLVRAGRTRRRIGAAGAARRARASGGRRPSLRCTRPSAAAGDVVLGEDEHAHAKSAASCSRSAGRELEVERLERRAELLRPPRPDDHRRHVRVRRAARRSRARRASCRARAPAPRTPRARRRPVVLEVEVRLGPQRHPRAGRRLLAAAVLPCQPAARQRAERRVAEPSRGRRSQIASLVLALEQGVGVLGPRRRPCRSASSSQAASTLLPP